MKRFHLALAVYDLDASIADYSARLGAEPSIVIPGVYALWRIATLNLSIKQQPELVGQLRHLGFEDDSAEVFQAETDLNGITWERFSSAVQEAEIEEIYGIALRD